MNFVFVFGKPASLKVLSRDAEIAMKAHNKPNVIKRGSLFTGLVFIFLVDLIYTPIDGFIWPLCSASRGLNSIPQTALV